MSIGCKLISSHLKIFFMLRMMDFTINIAWNLKDLKEISNIFWFIDTL